MTEPAILALEDGTVFRGLSVGSPGRTIGEVVFNTALTGYQEILTDPSYCRQIVTLTYPHIGNVGTNSEDMESGQIHASGLVIRDMSMVTSSWRSEWPLDEFLRRARVVAIADIDTRRLTRLLRDKGAQSGCIIAGADASADEAVAAARKFPGLKGMDLARVVTTAQAYQWNQGSSFPEARPMSLQRQAALHVVAYDFGIKRNILRLLVDAGCRVTVVRAQTPASEVLGMAPDGVFLSNGPGDPEPCSYAIDAAREVMAAGVPLFGICLGHQLLGLASGARTLKMKFGHHGANHPVQELDSGRVMISSQNHGFAVDEGSLPDNLRATHRSLFDGSLQGIERTDCPAFGFQGHPEASPGPHDLRPLFERFTALMRRHRAARTAGAGTR
ncbi:MAG: glutamine-hydrolyzing carbamoyl-phosphate synthase small subunit [Gammaproteobacteria bacterium]|nr:glutamine-hydrolyzing carbamoyl-phosphate synthase small subunit [Gammaproteobacteria bacterium]TVQ43484.1 MAG: carbamoyl-phosphate synthase small subunit [Gammaproteobacteria bacterium]